VNVERFEAMGCAIVVAGTEPAAVAAVLEEWEDTFSLYRPGSELSRVNRSRTSVVAVSPLFARALTVALDVAAETGGLIDPTLCGRWREVRLAGRVLSRPAGLALDLNGVVKSLAVDAAAAELITDEGFVSAGGDIAVRGPVDVALPRGGAIRVVEGGLATSGTASRGQHLIDPRSGEPSNSPWEQVTVSGSSCLAADIAAKVAFLLGADGPAWLVERGIPGRFVAQDGEIVESAAWRGALACT
jgi:thiamine biosynthesis lipoprotein